MAELTKERLKEIHAEYSKPNHSKSFSVKDSEIAEMARQLLAGMEQEPVSVNITRDQIRDIFMSNGFTIKDGQTDLKDYVFAAAEELISLSRSQSPVSVPDERYQHLSELYHAQEKRLFKLAQRIKGSAFDKYAAPQLPQPAVAVPSIKPHWMNNEFNAGWNACRAAMLKHSAPFIVTGDHRMMEMPKVEDIDAVAAMLQGAEPVATVYKLPFEQWLSQQTGTIDVECGCVMTEVFYHWLRVAYEAGNSPVIHDGLVAVPVDMTPEQMRAVQLNSELGAYAAANLSGAYSLFREFWDVAIAAAPKQEVDNG